MEQVNNLDALAEKIYQEGIEKARKEADALLENAKNEAEEQIRKAKAEAESIRQQAEKQATQTHDRLINEAKLKIKQFVADLSDQIENLMHNELLHMPVKNAMEEPAFIRDLILRITDGWHESSDIDVLISDNIGEKEKEAIRAACQQKLPGMEIQSSANIKSGFRIVHRKDGYFLDFSDEAFTALLRPYFSDQLQKLLFGS